MSALTTDGMQAMHQYVAALSKDDCMEIINMLTDPDDIGASPYLMAVAIKARGYAK